MIMVHKFKDVPKNLTLEGLWDFARVGNFEVYTFKGTIESVGLRWGESKRLERLGISRSKQIQMLNWLEKHPTFVKENILYR